MKAEAEEKGECKKRRKRDTDRLWHAVISLWGGLRRAPTVYWFSEPLCSHCYPRVLSTVHWTHTAPRAVIPVWETPALSTGPSHSTQPSAPFIPIHAYVSIAYAEEVAGNQRGIRASRLRLTSLKSIVYAVENREYVPFFFQMRELGWYSTASWWLGEGWGYGGGLLILGWGEKFRSTKQTQLFPFSRVAPHILAPAVEEVKLVWISNHSDIWVVYPACSSTC